MKVYFNDQLLVEFDGVLPETELRDILVNSKPEIANASVRMEDNGSTARYYKNAGTLA